MSFRASDDDFGPFFYRPDPEKSTRVAAMPEKLVRRGPVRYFMVGIKPDGQSVEAQLGCARLQIFR